MNNPCHLAEYKNLVFIARGRIFSIEIYVVTGQENGPWNLVIPMVSTPILVGAGEIPSPDQLDYFLEQLLKELSLCAFSSDWVFDLNQTWLFAWVYLNCASNI